MSKHLSVPAAFASAIVILAAMPVFAQTGKAPCSSFQKLPDGRWKRLKAGEDRQWEGDGHDKSGDVRQPYDPRCRRQPLCSS